MGTVVDITGALLSLISAYFYIKEKPVAWLISLFVIPLDIAVDITIGIYGDLFLQVIYFVILVYGWRSWRGGTEVEEGLTLLRMTAKQFYSWASLAILIIVVAWFGLQHYTNSEVALMDAIVTCLSLVATCLLCRKVLESWLLWIVVDCLYAMLFLYKQMPFHGAMSFFDAGMCVVGYLYWVKTYRVTPDTLAMTKNTNPNYCTT